LGKRKGGGTPDPVREEGGGLHDIGGKERRKDLGRGPFGKLRPARRGKKGTLSGIAKAVGHREASVRDGEEVRPTGGGSSKVLSGSRAGCTAPQGGSPCIGKRPNFKGGPCQEDRKKKEEEGRGKEGHGLSHNNTEEEGRGKKKLTPGPGQRTENYLKDRPLHINAKGSS